MTKWVFMHVSIRDVPSFFGCKEYFVLDLVTSTALGLCLTLYRHLQLPIPATSVHCTTTQIIFYITAIFLDYVGCPKVRGMRTFSYNTVLNIAFKKKKLNRNLKFSNVETRNRRIFSATYV